MTRIVIMHDDEKLKTVLSASGYDVRAAKDNENYSEYDLVIAPPSYFVDPATAVNISKYSEKLYRSFISRDPLFEEHIDAEIAEMNAALPNTSDTDDFVRGVCIDVARKAFDKNEWMELYFSFEEYTKTKDHVHELVHLQKNYTELFPSSGGDEEKVILYILNNPESDIRLKTLAAKMYVNSSYLSTVFAARTGIRFVDYLTGVKLRRAAYLLTNSSLKVSEIAERLDYKDIGYFSRIFKSSYGMPPSEYRMPRDYIYMI